MIQFKYSKWDGTQEPFSLDIEEIIGRLSDLFLDTSDFSWALSMMMRKGITDEQGQRVVLGIDEMLRKIRGMRQQYLSRYSPARVFEEMCQRLNQLLAAERRHLEEFFEQYHFRGKEPLSFEEAWKLREIFQLLDQLEQALENTRWGGDIEEIDSSLVRKLLGEEAYRAIEQWKQVDQLLTEAGYMVKSGSRSQVTPKGIRKIGQKALKDIFAALKRDALGQHLLNLKGIGGSEAEDTKRYQYGDPFSLDLGRTLMNSLGRQGGRHRSPSPGLGGEPIRKPPPRPLPPERKRQEEGVPGRPLKPRIELSHEDFEVYQMQHLTESSTVLMLDMSWSMAWFNRFFAAKKVALALYHLIKGQFPKDNLFVVGFYSTARELSFAELPFAQLCAGTYGTNMQAGLRVSSRLLARERSLNKQIIMVTDGEPTAHYEDGQLFFQYPPGEKTLLQTLREVERCTRAGITINVFMLSSDYYLTEFVNRITQINKGRAFYTMPENLGKYLLIDYISGKRKRIS